MPNSDLLKGLQLRNRYKSYDGGIVDDFYVPCLSRAISYDRAVAYFTSSSLSLIAKGVAHLIGKEGKMRLVVSPFLDEADIKAISNGYENKDDVVKTALEKNFDGFVDDVASDRLNALAWLIHSGHLEIKLAIPENPTSGFYHEKIGVFRDASGGAVAFTGSANETYGGFANNYESIFAFCSWKDNTGIVQDTISDFESLWEDNAPGLTVRKFTEEATKILGPYKQALPPDVDPQETRGAYHIGPSIPHGIDIRDYQKEVIKGWFAANGSGFYEMATGSGKTITALATLVELYEKAGLRAVIIVCPYQHLVRQWSIECKKFGLNPIEAFVSVSKWNTDLTKNLSRISTDPTHFVTVVVTNDTFASETFQSKIPYFPIETLLIVDEAHNMGAASSRRALPDSIQWRLALSATPRRWFDEEGTEGLFDYFGQVIEPTFGLNEAIKEGFLSEYLYYPVLVELTDDEQEKYIDLSEQIARRSHMSDDESEGDGVKWLLLERARLISSARNKLVAFEETVTNMGEVSHMLVYCGDGKLDMDLDEAEEVRQIDAITQILGNKLGVRTAQYVHSTSLADREKYREELDNGTKQAIIAIRCLDEGVDIPSIKTAVIIASSTNPRQFIQRRGRILRKSPTKDISTIYDMIVIPPADVSVSKYEQKLLRRELSRFIEFASLAKNANQAREVLLPVQKKYGLLDL